MLDLQRQLGVVTASNEIRVVECLSTGGSRNMPLMMTDMDRKRQCGLAALTNSGDVEVTARRRSHEEVHTGTGGSHPLGNLPPRRVLGSKQLLVDFAPRMLAVIAHKEPPWTPRRQSRKRADNLATGLL